MNGCDQLDVSVPLIEKLFQVSWNRALELMVTTPELELKAELLGARDVIRDVIRVEKWDMAHPVEAAERRRFVEGVLAMSKKRSGRSFWVNPSLRQG